MLRELSAVLVSTPKYIDKRQPKTTSKPCCSVGPAMDTIKDEFYRLEHTFILGDLGLDSFIVGSNLERFGQT